MTLMPVAGYTHVIHYTLQHYVDTRSHFYQTPDTQPAAALLGLFPLATSDTMVLAALSAVLSSFLPCNEDRRTEIAQRLSLQAVRGISDAMSHSLLARRMDLTILAADSLHLSTVCQRYKSRVHANDAQ